MPVLSDKNVNEFIDYIKEHARQYVGIHRQDITHADRLRVLNIQYKTGERLLTDVQSDAIRPKSKTFGYWLNFLTEHHIPVKIKLNFTEINLADEAVRDMIFKKVQEKFLKFQTQPGRVGNMASYVKTVTGMSFATVERIMTNDKQEIGLLAPLLFYTVMVEPVKFPPIDRVKVDVCPLLVA